MRRYNIVTNGDVCLRYQICSGRNWHSEKCFFGLFMGFPIQNSTFLGNLQYSVPLRLLQTLLEKRSFTFQSLFLVTLWFSLCFLFCKFPVLVTLPLFHSNTCRRLEICVIQIKMCKNLFLFFTSPNLSYINFWPTGSSYLMFENSCAFCI